MPSTGFVKPMPGLHPVIALVWLLPIRFPRAATAERRSSTSSTQAASLRMPSRTRIGPGEANVHVSIVNWVKSPEEPINRFTLDGVAVLGISTTLRPGLGTGLGEKLVANRAR